MKSQSCRRATKYYVNVTSGEADKNNIECPEGYL